MTATERTICCLLENFQTPDGVVVPEPLRPFMLGIDFIPFRKVRRRGPGLCDSGAALDARLPPERRDAEVCFAAAAAADV